MTAADFWSRRKARVLEEEQDDLRVLERDRIAKEEEAQAQKTDEELLEELGLPDPDTLQAGDDFSVFMSKAVPDRLRRRALRKLWLSNPALANLDGLIDYGEDFTDSATVIENLQTAYQVGKGMLAHVEALAEKDAAEDETADDALPEEMIDTAHDDSVHTVAIDNADERGDETGADVAVLSSADEIDDISHAADMMPFAETDEAYAMPVSRRRMRISFQPAGDHT